MALSAFVAPIAPGKTEQWRAFAAQIAEGGARHAEYAASRRAAGVRERAFLQHTPMGDFVIVTLEGDDAAGAMARMVAADDAFTRWFLAQVQEVHGFDLREVASLTAPASVADSGPARAAT
jgi:hypothetical protein